MGIGRGRAALVHGGHRGVARDPRLARGDADPGLLSTDETRRRTGVASRSFRTIWPRIAARRWKKSSSMTASAPERGALRLVLGGRDLVRRPADYRERFRRFREHVPLEPIRRPSRNDSCGLARPLAAVASVGVRHRLRIRPVASGSKPGRSSRCPRRGRRWLWRSTEVGSRAAFGWRRELATALGPRADTSSLISRVLGGVSRTASRSATTAVCRWEYSWGGRRRAGTAVRRHAAGPPGRCLGCEVAPERSGTLYLRINESPAEWPTMQAS